MRSTVYVLVASVLLVVAAQAHGDMPINKALGVPGYPHCVRAHPEVNMTVDEAAHDLGRARPRLYVPDLKPSR